MYWGASCLRLRSELGCCHTSCCNCCIALPLQACISEQGSHHCNKSCSIVWVSAALQLLNAKPENVERESEIVAQSGRAGQVTIATNMAGRGTDILLGGNPDFMARWVGSKLCQV